MRKSHNRQVRFDRTRRLDWLRLARTPRIGPVSFFQLLERYGDASQVLDALSRPASNRHRISPLSLAEAERELAALEAWGGQLLCAGESDYPAGLKQLTPPPPILSCLGRTELAHRPCIALVGSRQASAAGRKLARDIASKLSGAGYVCVSGLARGIDSEVHTASLEGGTIAVLAGGLDHIYPAQNARLYKSISETGLILSENAFGYTGRAQDFPRRNRLITGLSSGVVVIEAAERSGSLISARTAGEQGREVMAVPGSPLDPRAAGSNRLIREGATLVRNADDVLEALSRPGLTSLDAPSGRSYQGETDPGALPAAQIEAVFEQLSYTPMPIDLIAQAAGLSAARCAAILVELELSGKVETLAGGLALLAVDTA